MSVQKVFISHSRDMDSWAAIAGEEVVRFSRLRGAGRSLVVADFHDIDPTAVDAALPWQEHVGSPSSEEVALTIVLLGERVGTPLPAAFSERHAMASRLARAGVTWVHVAGVHRGEPAEGQVPLTGLLYEYFDVALPRLDGQSAGGPLRVFLRLRDAPDGLEFGSGLWREHLGRMPASSALRRAMNRDYDQQLEWVETVYARLWGQGQLPYGRGDSEEAFVAFLRSTLSATFGTSRGDPERLELPGLAPYGADHAGLYFGRTEELVAVERAAFEPAQPAVVVVDGESGAGKSSLVRAGLVTAARRRRRQGWRVALMSLADVGIGGAFVELARALAGPDGWHELGEASVFAERVDSVAPGVAAEILYREAHQPERPKLCLIVDQIELALDVSHEESPVGEAARAFLQLIGALCGRARGAISADIEAGPPVTVVLPIPTHRSNELETWVEAPPAARVRISRGVGDASLRAIVGGTFEELGLTVQPGVIQALSDEAAAVGADTSVLPLLSVALKSIHEGWKRNRTLARRADAEFDITLADFIRDGRIGAATNKLGEAAWEEAQATTTESAAYALSASQGRSRALIDGALLDTALARLMRLLVAVSPDEGRTPDRLLAAPIVAVPDLCRPLLDALCEQRLIVSDHAGRHRLVHETVLTHWERAAEWRTAESTAYRTEALLLSDLTRREDLRASGSDPGARYLWEQPEELGRALDFLLLRGEEEDPKLTAFIIESSIATSDAASLNRCLRVAALLGDEAWLDGLLALNADPNAPASDGHVAITSAAVGGSIAAVKRLLEAGAIVDPPGDNNAPLAFAAWIGNLEMVDFLLAAGADPAHESASGSALAFAAQRGRDDIVARLLEAGAPTEPRLSEAPSALQRAASGGHIISLQRLVERAADLDRPDPDGHSAITLAATSHHWRAAALLVRAGCLLPPSQGSTANVLCAVIRAADPGSATADNGALELLAALRDSDCDLVGMLTPWDALDLVDWLGDEASTWVGITPETLLSRMPDEALHLAARSHKATALKWLLAWGREPNARNRDGVTVVMEAARSDYIWGLERLLEAGASLGAKDALGQTALHHALDLGGDAATRLLIQQGADIRAVDGFGLSPLGLAITTHQSEMTAELLSLLEHDMEALQIALWWAVVADDAGMQARLTALGADMHRPAPNGMSPAERQALLRSLPPEPQPLLPTANAP